MTARTVEDGPDGTLCPSSRCMPGSILLGVVQGDGTVAYLPQKLVVDDDFVARAREGRSPEKRFRFSNRCVQHACRQWTDDRCSVIDRMLDHFGRPDAEPVDLPKCSIRPTCRWFGQNGAEACSVCPLIVTDAAVTDDSELNSPALYKLLGVKT